MQDRQRTGVFIAVGLFLVYVAVGYVWATKTAGLVEPDVLFHADSPRVVWNETSIGHTPGRTVLHPLHVLMTVPIGVPLSKLMGLREFAAVLISAGFAAGAVYNFYVLLRDGTALPAAERVLFVLLLGTSAGHAMFASIPETHVISTFFLSLVACHFVAKTPAPIAELPARALDWGRLVGRLGLIPMVLAAGALVTNLVLAPVYALLAFSRSLPVARRLGAAVVVSGAAVVLLGVLYFAQRAVLFGNAPNAGEGPHAAAVASVTTSASVENRPPHFPPAPAAVAARQAKPGGAKGWLGERFARELRYVTLGPRRLLEVSLAVLVFNLYTPRVVKYLLPPHPEGYAVSKLTAVRLDYFAFDLRPVAWIGIGAWVIALVLAVRSLLKGGELRRFFGPAPLFVSSWLALYLVVFSLYHVYPIDPSTSNDIFLFAPNLVLPVLFLVAAAYAHGLESSTPRFQQSFRAALAVATLAALVNTSIHTFDLLSYYAATPVPS
jgi:hypothetical protein